MQNLGLIRENLSKELQSKLDNNITIDEKTGSISLPAEVLFDKDSYVLKNEAKASLRKILSEYFDAILEDPKIFPILKISLLKDILIVMDLIFII